MNNNGINVLSLFDGMSCGQIALREAGIKVNKYFASEIDKFAIQQTQHNFPDTVQLGSVTGVHAADLPHIDLLIGGSPCQGFSFAGKQLNFNDPRSVLFFEYVRILREIQEYNPGVLFLLENVRMRKECEQVITDQLGLEPVVINSALVSAQNRVRLYWTNIRTREEANLFDTKVVTDIPQPEDRGIFIEDILEDNAPARFHYSEERKRKLLGHSKRQKERGNNFGFHPRRPDGKTNCLTSVEKDNLVVESVCLTPRRTEYGKAIRRQYEAGEVQESRHNMTALEPRTDGKTNTLTTVQKDNLILQLPHGFNEGAVFRRKAPTVTSSRYEANNLVLTREVVQINPGTESGGKQPYQQNRVYSAHGLSPALCSAHAGHAPAILTSDEILRRLTPKECCRLQTVPDWYEWTVSETQTYVMLGNGWTVDVIKHIFQFINTENLR